MLGGCGLCFFGVCGSGEKFDSGSDKKREFPYFNQKQFDKHYSSVCIYMLGVKIRIEYRAVLDLYPDSVSNFRPGYCYWDPNLNIPICIYTYILMQFFWSN